MYKSEERLRKSPPSKWDSSLFYRFLSLLLLPLHSKLSIPNGHGGAI